MQFQWSAFKTEAEYDLALERTIEIFHSPQGTPECDELNLLLKLVMQYEDVHFPIAQSLK